MTPQQRAALSRNTCFSPWHSLTNPTLSSLQWRRLPSSNVPHWSSTLDGMPEVLLPSILRALTCITFPMYLSKFLKLKNYVSILSKFPWYYTQGNGNSKKNFTHITHHGISIHLYILHNNNFGSAPTHAIRSVSSWGRETLLLKMPPGGSLGYTQCLIVDFYLHQRWPNEITFYITSME